MPSRARPSSGARARTRSRAVRAAAGRSRGPRGQVGGLEEAGHGPVDLGLVSVPAPPVGEDLGVVDQGVVQRPAGAGVPEEPGVAGERRLVAGRPGEVEAQVVPGALGAAGGLGEVRGPEEAVRSEGGVGVEAARGEEHLEVGERRRGVHLGEVLGQAGAQGVLPRVEGESQLQGPHLGLGLAGRGEVVGAAGEVTGGEGGVPAEGGQGLPGVGPEDRVGGGLAEVEEEARGGGGHLVAGDGGEGPAPGGDPGLEAPAGGVLGEHGIEGRLGIGDGGVEVPEGVPGEAGGGEEAGGGAGAVPGLEGGLPGAAGEVGPGARAAELPEEGVDPLVEGGVPGVGVPGGGEEVHGGGPIAGAHGRLAQAPGPLGLGDAGGGGAPEGDEATEGGVGGLGVPGGEVEAAEVPVEPGVVRGLGHPGLEGGESARRIVEAGLPEGGLLEAEAGGGRGEPGGLHRQGLGEGARVVESPRHRHRRGGGGLGEGGIVGLGPGAGEGLEGGSELVRVLGPEATEGEEGLGPAVRLLPARGQGLEGLGGGGRGAVGLGDRPAPPPGARGPRGRGPGPRRGGPGRRGRRRRPRRGPGPPGRARRRPRRGSGRRRRRGCRPPARRRASPDSS